MKRGCWLLLVSLLQFPALVAADRPDVLPRPIKQVPPTYTEAMRAQPLQGVVVVELDVGVDGLVTNAQVFQSLSPDADRAALESVRQWVFTPARKDGQPVAMHTRISVRFGTAPVGVPATFDTPPQATKRVPPQSTDAMRRGRLHGTVTVECIVNEAGAVTEARVTRSLEPDADQAALDCVRQWRFKPALLHGQPVKARVVLPIRFDFN